MDVKPLPESEQSPAHPLEYANSKTPMMSSPFPSPRVTAWVTLCFATFWAIAGLGGAVYVIVTINDSPEPFGAFVCMLVPIGLIAIVLIGLIVETVRSFRRAAEDDSKQRKSVKRLDI